MQPHKGFVPVPVRGLAELVVLGSRAELKAEAQSTRLGFHARPSCAGLVMKGLNG